MPTLTRRKAIIGASTLAGGCAITLGGMAIIGPRISTWLTDTSVNSPEHNTPLQIPPLYEGKVQDGVRAFSLELQTGESAILEDKSTPTWGVNGSFLGPTIRMKRGETVQMDVQNNLGEDTSIHWHGMHLPPEMDGGPHQMIAAGESWLPVWDVNQPACTLWYHPHPHGETADHVWNGIAGMLIVDDDEDASVPTEYGVDDLPLIIQDRGFEGNGEFKRTEFAFGYFGDHILVNGTYGARFDVTRQLTRFRILNGSNTRWYNLTLGDGRPFRLIATDNGYVGENPPELTHLLISPGERAEIVVEFAAGDDVLLQNESISTGKLEDFGADIDFGVIRFVAADELEASEEVRLPTFDSQKDEPASENRRRYTLSGHSTINDKEMDMSRIDDVITAGAVEIWEAHASNFSSHNFHIHGVTFEVLDIDGSEPPLHQQGPKDTVQLMRDTTATLRVTFPEYTDERYPYMYHCHILRHEDQGMMGQFLVVEPGREDAVPTELDTSHAHH